MTMDPIAFLIDHGEEHGCVHLTELHGVLQKLELDDDEVEGILERLEAHGIELTDDCSRAIEEDVTYTNTQVASATTDSLQLFLNETGRYLEPLGYILDGSYATGLTAFDDDIVRTACLYRWRGKAEIGANLRPKAISICRPLVRGAAVAR